MVQWIIGYVATALAFLGLDAIWLNWAASRLYRPKLGALLREDFSMPPAIAFYVIYVTGILIFAVAPALESGRWTSALWRGAMLGFLAYATYDLTNQATLKGWSASITLADLAWGTFVTASAAISGFAAIRWLIARG